MTREEILAQLQDIFRDIFDDATLVISEDTDPDTVDDWDSLAQISLIASIQDEYGIELAIEDAEKLHSVGDMVDVVLAYTE